MSSLGKVIGCISETLNPGEFVWRISNCSEKLFEVKTGDYLFSPTFSFSSCSWFFCIYPNGCDSSCEEYISLFLQKKESQDTKYVSYSLDMTFQGIQLNKCEMKDFFKKDKDDWGWYKYILRKKVLDHWSKETKSCSQLTIKIRLRDSVFYDEDTLLKVRTKENKTLYQSYKDLLLCGEDHDLILKVNDKEFKAHRIIMQCRCPVFKSMLTHEMLEKNSGVVEIPDCDLSAFEQFLFYIYTGELEALDESIMLGLYYIADKYDVADLKEKCYEFIRKTLSIHNICDVIRLAINHSNTSLLEYATEYFVNNVREILVTVEWQSFIKESPVQANELLIKTINKVPLYLSEKKKK